IFLACIFRVTAFEILEEALRLSVVAGAEGGHGAREVVIGRVCNRCWLARRRLEHPLRLRRCRPPRPGRRPLARRGGGGRRRGGGLRLGSGRWGRRVRGLVLGGPAFSGAER